MSYGSEMRWQLQLQPVPQQQQQLSVWSQVAIHAAKMQDRSLAYNNAGALILTATTMTTAAGRNDAEYDYPMIALELFRGALESKLAYDRQKNQYNNNGSHPEVPLLSSWESFMTLEAVQCIYQAESHMCQLPTYLSSYAAVASSPDHRSVSTNSRRMLSNPSITPDALYQYNSFISPFPAEQIVVPVESRGYDPFLYTVPSKIPDEPSSEQLSTCCILYNVALALQMVCPTAHKTRELYAIAASIVTVNLHPIHSNDAFTNTVVTQMRVAIFNNLAVWSYENDHPEMLSHCVEHLPLFLKDTIDMDGQTMDPKDIAGIRSNMRYLLVPPKACSPAA